MPDGNISRDSILALLLGGREGESRGKGMTKEGLAESESRSRAFARSAEAVRQYLESETGLGLPRTNILWLFDNEELPDRQLAEVGQFLAGKKPRAILVYFVGHGEFLKSGGKADLYHLSVRKTDPDALESALAFTKLLTKLRRHAPGVPCLFVIDACHAGRAFEVVRRGLPSSILEGEETQEASFFPLKGLAILSAASRDDFARAPLGASHTMFSGALVDVLRWGVSSERRTPAFSPRDLWKHVKDRLKYKHGRHAVEPEFASTDDDGGIPALPLFPNPAAKFLPWCVVLSDSDPAGADGSLPAALTRFVKQYGPEVRAVAGADLGVPVMQARASELVRSAPNFHDAVTAVCRSELAFFDVTNFEPAVMLLLGIRTVARRGVTVCSIGHGHRATSGANPPFHFNDINVVPHWPATAEDRDKDYLILPDEEPERLLGERALVGLREARQFPQHYLDLPCYDAIRHLASSGRNAEPIPYYRQALVLCSFSREYRGANWKSIRRDLRTAIVEEAREDATAQGELRGRDPAPRILRTLDMYSPRLVSHALLDAMLRTKFCLVDWTEWRPSVFFELGVRLGLQDRDPVCIGEASALTALEPAGPEPAAVGHPAGRHPGVLEQCRSLKALFAPLGYSLGPEAKDPTAQYRDLIRRHQRGGPDGSLPPNFTYRAVWDAVEPRTESATAPVEEFLRQTGQPLLVEQRDGQMPFVYPRDHSLSRMADNSGFERLLAGWLYLHYRVGRDELRKNAERALAYRNLAHIVTPLLRSSEVKADEDLAGWIEAQLEEFEKGSQV
ncbi:MAG TPA: caspase family protein [Gemmataceae bacterium]|nr:caspase family protein [Gemmataceae bacterium]